MSPLMINLTIKDATPILSFEYKTELIKVYHHTENIFQIKKLPAQNTCQFVLCFPVSNVAVLPIKNNDPVIPMIVPISGRYFLMLKAWSLAV